LRAKVVVMSLSPLRMCPETVESAAAAAPDD
jgi:hypothetical protein